MRCLFLALFSTVALASEPVSPMVEELLPRVVKVMGLPMPRKVKVKLISRAEAERLLRVDLDAPAMQRLGEALIAIGLLPPKTRLETLAPDFHRKNVSGFYDLREHTLFLLEDQTDEAQRPIIAHELAHAVQDANVDLGRALQARRNSEDAQLAFTAVIEGQAQATAALVMDGWLRDQHVAVEGMAGLLSDTTARSAAEAAEQAPVPWLGLQLRFPYVAGRELIAARSTEEDPIARGLLIKPPASTSEVMDPSRTLPLLSGELRLEKLIPGAKKSVGTTLGRANLELFGAGLGQGWRGDRLESVRINGKVAVVLIVSFESGDQSSRFAEAVKGSVHGEVVVLMVGVPPELVRAVLSAALAVFR